MQIRQLDLTQRHDFELMLAHIDKLYTELFGPDAVPSSSVRERLREQINASSSAAPPRHWAFLAQDGEAAPVGFMTLAESFAVFAGGRYGIIGELWVDEAARSRGVGARLVQHCGALGRERGWTRIDVSAPPSAAWDRSFNFYLKQGLTLTGRKLKYML